MEFKSMKDLVRIVENALAVQFYGLPGGQTNVLRKTVLKVLATVLGGALYMLSLIEKKIWKNRFCSTCDVAALDGFGTEYGVPHKAPMSATGFARVTLASGTSSVTIPAGTVLTDSSSSLEYEVQATTVVTASAANVPVKALVYGPESNLEDGVVLEFRDGDIEGVASMVSSGIAGGTLFQVEIDGDVQDWGETAEDYRARLLNRIQNPVNGGSKNDYVRWATRFQYVTDAFVKANIPFANSVCVAIANYNDQNIACTSGQVNEVKNYITDDVRRPITADVRVFSVTPVNFSIAANVTPFNDSVKESAAAAIRQYLRKVGPGNSIPFESLELVVLSNSSAETFTITSAVKGSTTVSVISLDYSVSQTPGTTPVAEVAKLSFDFRNGDI